MQERLRVDDRKESAYWSGYAAGKPGPDPKELIPLDATELRGEAQRYRREADRLDGEGGSGADKLRQAANDFEERARRLEG